MPLPLDGIKVIDLSEVWAGPMSCSLLGDMGAQVVKVESYPRAPMTRPVVAPTAAAAGLGGFAGDSSSPRPWDRSATHNMCNRNKYGIALDLTHPKGKEVFKKLVEITDILVEGYSAGTVDRLGLGYSVLKEIKPDLIMISMPGWGAEGPYKGYVTLGSGIDATSGHHSIRGYPGTDPSETQGIVHSDSIGAGTVVFAVLTALYHRRRTGKGQWIDMSQLEALLPHMAWPLLDWQMNGRVAAPLGNRDRVMVPQGCYKCQGEDEWVVISVVSDGEWEALCRAMGKPELVEDERFSDLLSRHENHDEMDRIIGEWTAGRANYQVMETLQKAGVAAGPVLHNQAIYADPHLNQRGFFEEGTHAVIGTHRYPGMLWKFSKMPMSMDIPPNALGEHNEHVLGQILHMSRDEIESLKAERVLGTDYTPDAAVDARDRGSQR